MSKDSGKNTEMNLHRDVIMSAILGCGRIAGIKDNPVLEGPITTHAQAYFRHPEFKLVSVFDSNHEKLNAFQSRWSVPYIFDDIQRMLEETKPMVVSICTNTNSHFPNLCTILNASVKPKIIFVEKPICETRNELEFLRSMCSESGTTILVNHSRRFDPVHRKIAHDIRNRKWGELVEAYCFYYGGLLNNGTHIIDTLLMFFGDNLKLIKVEKGKESNRAEDPCFDATLNYESAQIFIKSFPEKIYQLFEFDLRFEYGRLVLRNFGEDIIAEEQTINAIQESILEIDTKYPSKGLINPIYHAIEIIGNHVNKNDNLDSLNNSGTTIESISKTMELVWAISSNKNIS